MAVQNSPALPPMRPGLIDPSRQAEYPIFLGKSLPGNRTNAVNQLLNVRYNWKSKQIPQRQVITEDPASTASYKLVVREGSAEPYKYSGTVDPNTTDPDSADLALVFDKEKSAFMLESISRSLNFNLTSATTKPNIELLHQLETVQSDQQIAPHRQDHEGLSDNDEDAADAENPYDYRHFLQEARRHAEAGNTTPKPAITGVASPIPGASKTLVGTKPTTSFQAPFMGPSKRKRMDSKATSRAGPRTGQHATSTAQKGNSRTSHVASKGRVGHRAAEKITLSDEETEKVRPNRGKQANSRDESIHQPVTRSPQIIVDEASDLTIDMGSPPPKAKAKHRINPNAFANRSGSHSRGGTASVSPQGKDLEEGSEKDVEGRVEMDNDGDNDDIEDLALPSPRETRLSTKPMGRVTQDPSAEDDDEDDGLAAELEAVFDQEDDGENGTVGLGISANQPQLTVQNDEESEVSEEE